MRTAIIEGSDVGGSCINTGCTPTKTMVSLSEDGIAVLRLVPYTVFIDPQLGRVGMNETDALAGGRKIKVPPFLESRAES